MATIGSLTSGRVEWLTREFGRARMGCWTRPESYLRGCFQAQERGEMVVLVARADEELLGFVKVVWESDYAPFRAALIPEINDLLVAPANRRQGIASRLMDEAERIIRTRGPVAGLGVGLHPGYAAAQRMYVRRGYVPDGHPLTYRDQFAQERQQVTLDDDLVMHLVKEL
jgi:GNAT superfamily N-acetyltransferase